MYADRSRSPGPWRRGLRPGLVGLLVAVLAGCTGAGSETDASTGRSSSTTEPAVPAEGPQSSGLTGSAASDIEITGSVPAHRKSDWERIAGASLRQVEDLWGAGSVARPVRLVLPADAADFATLTGHEEIVRDVPATTVGSGADAAVVVHPQAWDRLSPAGRQAVLTHEVTHLAMQGDGPVPTWLGEGLAELTAHRQAELALTEIAGSALDPISRGELPEQWPDPSRYTDRWHGYAMAWLACEYIGREYSEEQLLGLYRAVADGDTMAQATAEVLGVSEAELFDGWLGWLRALP